METTNQTTDVVVIGAGLTGLTTAYMLAQQGKQVVVIEKEERIGGQIKTLHDNGYTFEAGPNTGVLSNIEAINLFETLVNDCEIEIANQQAKKRLIWKAGKFHALPHNLSSAITTPLFSWYDKFRILGEPFRSKGTDKNESVGALARRRLGKSFLNYAVDPFLSGIYAGDAHQLVTRFALPKLYNLEQNHGSFIRGAIAKKKTQTEADKKVTKGVFSAKGGLEAIVKALASQLPSDAIQLGCSSVTIMPDGEAWKASFLCKGKPQYIKAQKVITTVPGFELESLLPFVDKTMLEPISSLVYAPVIQASVGVKATNQSQFNAFGGLVPSIENRNVLGILYPSACFRERSPEGSVLFSFFMGGIKHPEILKKSTGEIRQLIYDELEQMLHLRTEDIEMLHVFKYEKAIPQYRADSELRYKMIHQIQQQYKGLILAGNIRDGIGMADRIKQGCAIASL